MSITSSGPCVLENQKKPSPIFLTRDNMFTGDIEGATSSVPYGQKYCNKPPRLENDIPGSSSRSLTHTRNVQNTALYLDDIEGTRHTVKDRMMRTKRHVNPLVPEYPLPSSVPADLPEVKFLKDTMNISDIEGSSAKPIRKYETRDTMSTGDIVGAKFCSRASLENPPRDIMSNGEIDLKKKKFQDRGNRKTNLMEPIYNINGVIIKDDEKYTKPKPLKKQISDNHLLQTEDIDGAKKGWKILSRREYRNTMITSDILGAQSDSIKHSIQSNRLTNPLAPVYRSLDGDPLVPPVVPLLPISFVDKPTLKQSKTQSSTKPTSIQNTFESNYDINGSSRKEQYSARSFADAIDNGEKNINDSPIQVVNMNIKMNLPDKTEIENYTNNGSIISGRHNSKNSKDSGNLSAESRAMIERQKEIDLVRAL